MKDVILFLTLILAAIAAPFVGLLLDPILSMSVMAAVLIAGSTKEKFLMPRLVESYKKILVIACEEASEWSMSNPRLGVDLTYSNPSSLEEVLQKRGMPIHVWIFALLQ